MKGRWHESSLKPQDLDSDLPWCDHRIGGSFVSQEGDKNNQRIGDRIRILGLGGGRQRFGECKLW